MRDAEPTPHEVADFSLRLAEAVATSSAGRLLGAYLHGSAAMGGWVANRSDVDLLLVLEDDATVDVLNAVDEALRDAAPACPGTGLECSAVASAQASAPMAPWPFLLHVQSSTGGPVRSVSGSTMGGDPDLLMHYTVCRARGVPVVGPEPQALFGDVSRSAVLGYLADELRWGLEHGSTAYAILNACRALVYATDGDVLSKLEGGRRALEAGLGPPALVAQALEQQCGLAPPSAIAPDAAAFVHLAIERLQKA